MTAGMTMKLSELLAGARVSQGRVSADIPADWMQGRSVFGGLQAVLALRAMRTLVPEAPLRTLQVTFIAPIAGTVNAQARVLRTGKNATHVEARIIDGDATQAIVIGVFGTARSSAVARMPKRTELDPGQAPLIELPFGTELGPAFTRHFQVKWLRGEPPFTGGKSTSQLLELAIDEDGPANETILVAVADFIPPIALSLLSAPTPGSTLTWMLELLADRFDHLPAAGFRVEAEMVAARDGYTSQAVAIFGANGEALALSHQSMLVFG